ncbi:membrane dipeptidase [Cellulomonas shaoxiangyii]|uniref:membrane dipeptidase n=1 Tax=Cellulomonas shaoxiangyii TaxID=2566013 RepID=UPI00141FDC20|nr:membrane dipeptidase [Cellulomonas shaoxiangyii]
MRGLADFHSHMFADLGFDGSLLTHSTDPAAPCRAPLTSDASTFRLADVVRAGLVDEAATQAASGRCFPTPTSRAGQQVDVDSLERAWRYGLRLVVIHAVNSEFLCLAAKITSSCPDIPSIEAQLAAARTLQNTIDATSGGPGTGWFRIVLTPAEARTVIGEGKLAVVLGVEAAGAFGGCAFVPAGVTPAVPPVSPFVSNPDETRWALNCNGLLPPLLDEGVTSRAVALMERYRELGARHFYLIHNLQGVAGGNSLSAALLHAVTNPSRHAPGSPFDRVADIDRVVRDVRPPITSFACPTAFAFDGGRCNSVGLTFTGRQLARAMANEGSVIDLDHLSIKAKRDLWAELGDQYPVVSSHSGFNEINGGDKSNEDQLLPDDLQRLIRWGGSVAPILLQGTAADEVRTYPAGSTTAPHVCPGTSETWVQAYRYAVDKLRTTPLAVGRPAFVGVGFGSDFNGLAGWPRPRFDSAGTAVGETSFDPLFVGGALTPVGGRCYLAIGGFPAGAPPHVTYPFVSPLTGESFDRSTLPWSGRSEPYDISFDGVAHVGMIPDFVEELRVLGLSDDELEPLWGGAEAYLRTWETAGAWAGNYGTEQRRGVRDACREARSGLAQLGTSVQATVTLWQDAMARVRSLGCDYLSDQATPSPAP